MKDVFELLSHYQGEAKKSIMNRFRSSDKCYAILPTGTGKTKLGLDIAKSFSGRVLWITSGCELIDETIERAFVAFDEKNDIGLIQQGIYGLDCSFYVASANSISLDHYIKEFPVDFFDLIIVDEVHHLVAPTWMIPINYFNAKVLGLTATDARLDGVSISEVCGDKVYEMTYEFAEKNGLIAKNLCKVVLTNSVIKGVRTRQKDYSRNQLDRIVVSVDRNNVIVDSYKKYARKEIVKLGMKPKAICFCIDIKHAMFMSELFTSKGISSKYIVSEKTGFSKKSRRDVYESFKNTHDIEVICVVDILNEGKDIPDVNIGLFAAPTMSPIKYMQRNGRLTRIIPGVKSVFYSIDFWDNVSNVFTNKTGSSLRYQIFSLSRNIKEGDIIYDYYQGKDRVFSSFVAKSVIDNYLVYARDFVWNSEHAIIAVNDYIKKYGVESFTVDSLKMSNFLPSRVVINALFGSYEKLVIATGNKILISRFKKGLNLISDKKSVSSLILNFSSRNGSMTVNDLGYKNGLPTKKVVNHHFGSWNNCKKELGLLNLKNRWSSKKSFDKAVLNYAKSNNGNVKTSDFEKSNSLPSLKIVKRYYKNISEMRNALNLADDHKKELPIGVSQLPSGKYRVRFYKNNKNYSVGTYDDLLTAVRERDRVYAIS